MRAWSRYAAPPGELGRIPVSVVGLGSQYVREPPLRRKALEGTEDTPGHRRIATWAHQAGKLLAGNPIGTQELRTAEFLRIPIQQQSLLEAGGEFSEAGHRG